MKDSFPPDSMRFEKNICTGGFGFLIVRKCRGYLPVSGLHPTGIMLTEFYAEVHCEFSADSLLARRTTAEHIL
jgi:hypothetical protein